VFHSLLSLSLKLEYSLRHFISYSLIWYSSISVTASTSQATDPALLSSLPVTLNMFLRIIFGEKSLFRNSSFVSLAGRAIAQAVSHRLPTAAARFRAQVSSCGICGGQSGTEVGFLRVLRFTLPIRIPPTAPHSSSIIRGLYNRPISGRRTKWILTPPQETIRNFISLRTELN
jgi:hypothetical protein